MPGGLRVLSTERALRGECRATGVAGPGACGFRGTRGGGTRRDAVLHGGGVATSAGGERVRESIGDGAGSFGAGNGSVLHAGDVERGAGAEAEGGGAFGLQPQSGYFAGVLWVDHHDASLRGAIGNAGGGAAGWDNGLLRRDFGDGRARGGPDWIVATVVGVEAASGERADQYVGTG